MKKTTVLSLIESLNYIEGRIDMMTPGNLAHHKAAAKYAISEMRKTLNRSKGQHYNKAVEPTKINHDRIVCNCGKIMYGKYVCEECTGRIVFNPKTNSHDFKKIPVFGTNEWIFDIKVRRICNGLIVKYNNKEIFFPGPCTLTNWVRSKLE